MFRISSVVNCLNFFSSDTNLSRSILQKSNGIIRDFMDKNYLRLQTNVRMFNFNKYLISTKVKNYF